MPSGVAREGDNRRPDGQDSKAQVLQPLWRDVFGNECGGRVGEFKVAWYGTLRRAGIRDLTFHDLRHEFGSRLIEAGVSLLTVSHLYGHKSIATTARYLNASERVVEREMALFQRAQQQDEPGATQNGNDERGVVRESSGAVVM
jgi:integrase